MSADRHVAVVVGDTAGHLFPALAFLEAYRRRRDDLTVTVIGEKSALCDLVFPASQWNVVPVRGAAFKRAGLGRRLRLPFELAAGLLDSRRLLRRVRARLVVGFGEYRSVGVVLAAKTSGIATLIHEANVLPGLANRVLARVADRIVLGCEGSSLGHAGAVALGLPLRRELIDAAREPRSAAPLADRLKLLVVGGTRHDLEMTSQLATLTSELQALGIGVEVRHVARDDGGIDRLQSAWSAAGVPARVSSFDPSMADAYRWADVAAVRGGAGSLAEIALFGLPALILPLGDAADDHQRANARWFASRGGAVVMEEEASARAHAIEWLTALARDPERWLRESAAARAQARPDAADHLVDACEDLLASRPAKASLGSA